MVETVALRILYMEDDKGLARLVQKRLGRQGYTVDLSEDGSAGLTRCRETAYDAVVVDHDMPGLTGLEVIRNLCSVDDNHTPVVMLTGQGDQQLAVDALKSGASDYLVKDVEARYLHILPSVLEMAIRNCRTAREKERLEEDLKASEAFNRAILQYSHDGIAVIGIDGALQFMSPGMARIIGAEHTSGFDLSSWGIALAKTAEEKRRFAEAWEKLINEGTHFEQVYSFSDAGDETRWVRFTFSRMSEDQVIINCQDVTASVTVQAQLARSNKLLEEKNRMLQELATTDHLTGISNRRALLAFSEQQWARANRMDEPFCAAILDIDHFKKVNDTYGHGVGDEVLKSVAGILKSSIRSYDQVGRWGGEEFMLVFPGITLKECLNVTERIRCDLAAKPLEALNRSVAITASLGISSRIEDGATTLEALFKIADEALYVAKNRGRNRIAGSFDSF